MANDKLTEDKLTELITEILQEKYGDLPLDITNFKKKKDYVDNIITKTHHNKTGLPSANDFKKLAGKDGKGDDISLDDYVASSPNDKVIKKVRYYGSTKHKAAAKLAGKSIVDDPTKMGKIKDINVDKQTYEPRSMAFGQMANIGSQASNPKKTTSLGKFPEGLASSINVFFKGKNTFKDRVDAISDFSQKILGAKTFPNLSVNEALAASLFLDYLTTIVTEMDSGTGAYQFETILAVMAGGTVVGKGDVSTSAGKSTGQMGAVDFVMNDGTLGSAKYYSIVSGGKITQALSGFNKKEGKSILYIIAQKKGDKSKTVGSGQSDPLKITQLNIYLVSVMPKVRTPKKGSDFQLFVNGGSRKDGVLTSKGKLNLSADIAQATPIVLKIAGGKSAALKDQLTSAANKGSAQLKNSFKYIKEVFDQLYQANQKVQRYAAEGDKTSGEAALTTLQNADNKFIDFAAEMSKKSKAKIKKTRKLEENKSLKKLDKLIERVILEHINK